MQALVFDGSLQLREIEPPVLQPGEVLIKVARAGICNTDHEIVKGYVPGCKGVLGHEFVGYIGGTEDASLPGKRVTGEINSGCGRCEYCARGLERHCPNRSVL